MFDKLSNFYIIFKIIMYIKINFKDQYKCLRLYFTTIF